MEETYTQDWISSLPKDKAGKMRHFRLLNQALKSGEMKFKRGERKLIARRLETLAKDILGVRS